jgi:hypothetical protein
MMLGRSERIFAAGRVLHAILPAASKGGVRPPWPKIRANIAATAPELWPVPALRPPASGSAAVNPAAQPP